MSPRNRTRQCENTGYLRVLLFILPQAFGIGCATDPCEGHLCPDNDPAEHGMSRLIAVDPRDGEIRWGADFQGEQLEVEGLSGRGAQVQVRIRDACWTEDRRLAFDVQRGSEVSPSTLDPMPIPPQDCLAHLTEAESREFDLHSVGGVCVGLLQDEERTLRAIDPLSGDSLWQTTFIMNRFYAQDDILIVETIADDGLSYRWSRLSPTTGQVLWIHRQAAPMVFLGADDHHVFLLDSAPAALHRSTGDPAWRTEITGWSFQAPERGHGRRLGTTLFVTRSAFPPSPCATE